MDVRGLSQPWLQSGLGAFTLEANPVESGLELSCKQGLYYNISSQLAVGDGGGGGGEGGGDFPAKYSETSDKGHSERGQTSQQTNKPKVLLYTHTPQKIMHL